MEIYIKNIKLINNSKAIVKSKWYNGTIELNIFVSNEDFANLKIFKGQCNEQEIRDQCDQSNIEFENMKNYLTYETNTDGIMYDITGNKFIVFRKEYLGSDSEGYADIINFKLLLKSEEISKGILLEQIYDIKHLTSIIRHNNESAKKHKESLKNIADSYEKLLIEKQEFEEKFYNKATALFNAKKKYINENIVANVTKLNIPHDIGTSDDTLTNNKKMDEKSYSSPSRTPSKRKCSTKVNKTPKRTPTRLLQRTPSKRLREIQDMSDSDDSFAVLSCDTNKKFASNPIADSLDSSRVFKDFKIKTPVKHNENTRESSVELKIDKNTNEVIDSENEHKSLECKESNHHYGQQMNVDGSNNKSQPLLDEVINDDEEIPCSQEMVDGISSFSERMSKRSRNKSKRLKTDSSANPYSVNTINILNISD